MIVLRCRICNCFCDPGDLINGICDDCRNMDEQKREKERLIDLMLNGNGEQMSIQQFMAEE